MKTKRMRELRKIAEHLASHITPETPGAWCEDPISICEEVARIGMEELTVEEGVIVCELLEEIRYGN